MFFLQQGPFTSSTSELSPLDSERHCYGSRGSALPGEHPPLAEITTGSHALGSVSYGSLWAVMRSFSAAEFVRSSEFQWAVERIGFENQCLDSA